MESPTVTLWRPVGHEELVLVEQSGWTRFPPRLAEQPIFYPVCNARYACEIAGRWNTRGGGTGYVLRFHVAADYLSRYEVQRAGARHHLEYWIPAEDLEAFNSAIVGPIVVVVKYGHARKR